MTWAAFVVLALVLASVDYGRRPTVAICVAICLVAVVALHLVASGAIRL